MIRIQGLHKFFNKGRQNEIHVINGIELSLPENGMIAIFGKSGCGKTTLLNVIGGLDGFAEGSITIEGNDVRHNTDDIRNKYIGYIFQNYNLNAGESCFDNVADALRLCGMTDEDEIYKRVTAALKNVGMDKYAKRSPDTLSGGQQQRIAIARAIVKNPKIILADEPTGNLDEANTVMIMDLLKAISRDHLVLLVTHEADLVDHYCSQVIELSDGRIVNVKSNESANGFAARDKNDIYLGELEKTSLCDGNAEIEFFGDKPSSPVKIRIVNDSGKLYVQLGTSQIQIIDEFSEVKLREGVYEEKTRMAELESNIDMSQLSPVEADRCGRLFSFKSSVKSGYNANFKASRKGKKALRTCMCLFSAVVVFMSAIFGSSIGNLIDADRAYNHNVFYLYTDNAETSNKLLGALGDNESGIDYIYLSGHYPGGDSTVNFLPGNFETFSVSIYQNNFTTNAVYLGEALADDLKRLAGTTEALGSNEVLITSAVADALIENSAFGYITEYRDLIGLRTYSFSYDGKGFLVAGVVESNESAIYLNELSLARLARNYLDLTSVAPASDNGISLSQGKVVLATNGYSEAPEKGKTVKIQGVELTVEDIFVCYENYGEYLSGNGIEKVDEETFYRDLIKQSYPSLTEGSDEYEEILWKTYDSAYYEYIDYYYAEFGDYLRGRAMLVMDDAFVWLYTKRGVEYAKYAFLPDDYFKAVQFKDLNGRFPTASELAENADRFLGSFEYISLNYPSYENDFYGSGAYHYSGYDNMYFVSDADYITMSRQLGETHKSALVNGYAKGDDVYYGDSYVNSDVTGMLCYTVIHSSDPEKTSAWLESNFRNIEVNEYWQAIVTPEDVYSEIVRDSMEAIVAGLVTMAVVLVIMSVCMYFIMRSSLMNRIKEVGIYRAIGVSKKNLLFRFSVESGVLSALTVMIGYLISSGFIFASLNLSPMVEDIFYYPVWLAGAVFLILAALSLICGTLPMLALLRKTPSEILAKYDI